MLFAVPRLRLAGDAAILVEWGDEISPVANARVYALADALAAADPPGIVEIIPAYCSLLVEYDPDLLNTADLEVMLTALAASRDTDARPPAPIKEIAVRYGGADGPDLAEVAAMHDLTPAQVIAAHSGVVYTVYMLGFSPGFAYLGTVPAEIASSRLPTPRTQVPAGSVGIAGQQTGIYPQEGPGGWRLIGRTSAALFDPHRHPPALLSPGDRVRFIAQPPGGTPGELALQARNAGRAPMGHAEGVPAAGAPLFEVLAPGWLATVQDAGRRGFQRYGVPVAGFMDPVAGRAANALLGNAPGAPEVEITLGGLSLRVLADTPAALAGADLEALLSYRAQGPWALPAWSALFLRRGAILEFRGPRRGCRAYLAVPGGFAVAPVMGSASTYLPGRFGGHGGRGLAVGDRLIAFAPDDPRHGRGPRLMLPRGRQPAYGDAVEVRVIFGPHHDYFTDAARAAFLAGPYLVSGDSDRIGLRLAGQALGRRDRRELVSCGTVPGAVQVPSDGQPIVLLADRQTTGGYPIIATVIQADIPLLAQCVPGGARVRFRAISIGEAQAARRALAGAWQPVDESAELLGDE